MCLGRQVQEGVKEYERITEGLSVKIEQFKESICQMEGQLEQLEGVDEDIRAV